jgi:DNA-binding CsgD family transcriptional regulator/pimeloyl-ACP methyl ester carboxylesterase
MQAPPVKYVTTSDGFNIAYSVAGAGPPFVFMPWPFSHRGLWWGTVFGRPIAETLARRFRLVQYDSRGQGMSTRGLPEDHSLDDYLLDLEAVVDSLGLTGFVLYAGPVSNHLAVHYAIKHPERLRALVLGDITIKGAWGKEIPGFSELIQRDWDFFLHAMASSFSLQGAPVEVPYWRESITQEDCIKMGLACHESDIGDLLPSLRVPTLILNTRRLTVDGPLTAWARDGEAIAAAIPNSRLITFDGMASIWFSPGPEAPQAVQFIEAFLNDLPGVAVPEPDELRIAALSRRQREVLHLISQGKTNREIADALVLSERTVQRHIADIYAKIGARNRAEATAIALGRSLPAE